MTISNSSDFSMTRDDIITEALELLGVIGEGDIPNSNQLTSSAKVLNMLVKSWQAEGLQLFELRTSYLLLPPSTREFLVTEGHSSYFVKSINAASANGAVSSGSDIIAITTSNNLLFQAGYEIVIELANGAIHSTTIVSNLSNVITLSTPVPSSVNNDATVYAFAEREKAPLAVYNVIRRNRRTFSDTPVEVINRKDYWEINNKTSTGPVNKFYYDRANTFSRFFIWPVSNSFSDYLIILHQKALEDFDAGTNTSAYPQEWYGALVYNLALFLSPKYGVAGETLNTIKEGAILFKEVATNFNMEENITFEFDSNGR